MHPSISTVPSAGVDRNAVAAACARAAFKALYLVSGAAAQLGANALPIEDGRWQALARATRDAHTALQARDVGHVESDAMAAGRRLYMLCDRLLERRMTREACTSALWRDLARAGREVYEYLDT